MLHTGKVRSLLFTLLHDATHFVILYSLLLQHGVYLLCTGIQHFLLLVSSFNEILQAILSLCLSIGNGCINNLGRILNHDTILQIPRLILTQYHLVTLMPCMLYWTLSLLANRLTEGAVKNVVFAGENDAAVVEVLGAVKVGPCRGWYQIQTRPHASIVRLLRYNFWRLT